MKLTKSQLWTWGGYIAFMLVFYFWGITKTGFWAFFGIAALAAVYAGLARVVKKVLAQ